LKYSVTQNSPKRTSGQTGKSNRGNQISRVREPEKKIGEYGGANTN